MSTEGLEQPYDLGGLSEEFDSEAVEVGVYETDGSVEVGINYGEGSQEERERAMETFRNQLSAYLQSTSTEPYIDGTVVAGPDRGKFRASNENLRTVERGVAKFLRELEDL